MSIDKLFKLQKRGLRMICDARWDAPSKDLFTLLEWAPLPQFFLQNDCKMVYKCMNTLAPNYLCKCFNQFKETGRITRQTENKILSLPHCKSTLYKKSFIFRGSALWNFLDINIKCSKSFAIFKRKIKEVDLTLPT